MEMRPTASPTARTPSVPANQVSRRLDTARVEVTLWRVNDFLLGFLSDARIHSVICFPDVNECLEFGVCSHICNNTKGSYKCSCHKHFTKMNDTCKADSKHLVYASFRLPCPKLACYYDCFGALQRPLNAF